MELVTDFARKYKFDLFYRTEFNIILLQIAFSVAVLIIIGGAMNYLYRDVSSTLVQGVIDSPIVVTTPAAEAELLQQLAATKKRNISIVVTITIIVTAAFGYLIARITLRPTRDALSFQKQFIGNVAHELRTPLATIKTNTEVALLDLSVGGVMRETLKSNVQELDRISDIINNLLSLNAFIRPERIAFANVDLYTVVTQAVRRLEPLSERLRVKVLMHVQQNTFVWGNAIALEQVVLNLLKNAITYTSEGGQVTLDTTNEEAGLIALSVADTGIGIAQKDLHHIFEPFYRADHSRARKHSGSGLGLAIVSELVKLHNGRITIRSAPKQGTTVIVHLPSGLTQEQAGGASKESSLYRGQVDIDFSRSKKSG